MKKNNPTPIRLNIVLVERLNKQAKERGEPASVVHREALHLGLGTMEQANTRSLAELTLQGLSLLQGQIKTLLEAVRLFDRAVKAWQDHPASSFQQEHRAPEILRGFREVVVSLQACSLSIEDEWNKLRRLQGVSLSMWQDLAEQVDVVASTERDPLIQPELKRLAKVLHQMAGG